MKYIRTRIESEAEVEEFNRVQKINHDENKQFREVGIGRYHIADEERKIKLFSFGGGSHETPEEFGLQMSEGLVEFEIDRWSALSRANTVKDKVLMDLIYLKIPAQLKNKDEEIRGLIFEMLDYKCRTAPKHFGSSELSGKGVDLQFFV